MSCWIKDSVHGDVFASDAAQELLETPEMQRLRRISQTSFSSTIYPGANHTRFEHSIGTYYLTNRYSFFHNIEKERGESTAAHALLHDIGHSCFSHALESVLENYLGKNHEEATEEIISNGRIKEILDKHGISPGYDASIIDSELGTDRMDYLMRDSKYTGVAYGAVDADRILRMMRLHNGKLVLDEKGLSAAESMLLARFMMFPSVYAHHVPRTAEEMIKRAVEKAVEAKAFRPEKLLEWDDWALMTALRGMGGITGMLANNVANRRLFKRALQKPLKQCKNWLYIGGLDDESVLEAEGEIAEKAGIDPSLVILNIPKPWFGDIKINVFRNNDYYSIGEVSLISRVLKEAQWDYCYVTVLCPKENVPSVHVAAKQVMEQLEASQKEF